MQLQRSMRPLPVVMRRVLGQDAAQMSFPEDQHPVGEFGTDGQYEAFGEAVRARTPGRDFDYFDTGILQYGIERVGELSGAVADQKPEPADVVAELHHEVAGLLRGPEPVGMPGHAQDVQVAVADLEHEQDVESPQRDRAVDVEEVDREHAGGLGAQELPPAGVGAPQWRWWDPVARLRVSYDLTALGPHAAERLETSRVNFTNYIGEWEAAIAAMSPAGA
jgi:hypothetical protein